MASVVASVVVASVVVASVVVASVVVASVVVSEVASEVSVSSVGSSLDSLMISVWRVVSLGFPLKYLEILELNVSATMTQRTTTKRTITAIIEPTPNELFFFLVSTG